MIQGAIYEIWSNRRMIKRSANYPKLREWAVTNCSTYFEIHTVVRSTMYREPKYKIPLEDLLKATELKETGLTWSQVGERLHWHGEALRKAVNREVL